MSTTLPPPAPALAAAAAEGRQSFVAKVLNDYTETRGRGVPDDVEQFILRDVLVPDRAWGGQPLDPDRTAQILHESLDEMYRRRIPAGPVEMTEARAAFETVIDRRWRCPYPFIFC